MKLSLNTVQNTTALIDQVLILSYCWLGNSSGAWKRKRVNYKFIDIADRSRLHGVPLNWSINWFAKVLLLPTSPPICPSDPVAAAVFSPSNRLLIPSNLSLLFLVWTPTIQPGNLHRVMAAGSTSFRQQYPMIQPTTADIREPGNWESPSWIAGRYM